MRDCTAEEEAQLETNEFSCLPPGNEVQGESCELRMGWDRTLNTIYVGQSGLGCKRLASRLPFLFEFILCAEMGAVLQGFPKNTPDFLALHHGIICFFSTPN